DEDLAAVEDRDRLVEAEHHEGAGATRDKLDFLDLPHKDAVNADIVALAEPLDIFELHVHGLALPEEGGGLVPDEERGEAQQDQGHEEDESQPSRAVHGRSLSGPSDSP